MAGDELARKGWHLSETGIKECSEDGNNRVDIIVKNALNTDLREIGAKWVPEGLQRGKLDYVQGPVVLQLSKLRNIAAPKDNEESQGAPRMMKLVLTDGHTSCTAVETEVLKNIGFNTAPGCKLLIEGTVGVESNILLLNNKNTRLLGGRVERLYETWELKRSLKYQNRSNIRSEGGPPPYVPFGQKVTSQLSNPRKDNFKSLDANKEKTGDDKNEFQQQRQAVIAEALQAKDSKTKTFGGGNKIVLEDHDVAKIIDMGFSLEDASNALRFANGNVNEAIHNLLSRGNNSRGRPKSDKPERTNDRPERNEQRNDRSDRFDKKDKMSSRPRRGGNQVEESSSNSQPSAPSTLFDFLTTKIPVKEETKPSSNSTYNQKPARSGTDYNSSSSRNNNTAVSSSNNSSYSSNSTKSNYSARTNNNNNTYHDKPHSSYDNHNYTSNNRRQNTVPPRFAQKYGKDSSESSYSSQSNSYNADSDSYDRTRSKRNENYRNENYRNDYNGGSRDNQRGKNYSQDPRKNDYYDSSSQRSSGASSRASGDSKKNSSDSTSKSNDTKYNGSRNNDGSKSQDTRSTSSNSQSQKSNSKWETRNVSSWNRGDMCLAKYWEDKQYYPAVIENTGPNGVTYIVTFPEYGNIEEVLSSDLMPMPAQNWNEVPQQVQFTAAPPPYYPQVPVCPQYQPDQYVVPGQFATMEFRRGGNGPQYTRNKTDKGRPTQNYYQPPSSKPYQ